MKSALLEQQLDPAFAEIVAQEDFEPRDTEATIVAERALVGAEEPLEEKFTPERVHEAFDVLKDLSTSVVQLPKTPTMSVTKRVLLGLSKEEAEREVQKRAEQAPLKLPENFDDLSEDKQAEAMQRSAQNRGTLRAMKYAVEHSDEATPVLLTPEVAEVAIEGIRIQYLKAKQAKNEADKHQLAGTAQWILEHTAEVEATVARAA